jgi:hypothetical protein
LREGANSSICGAEKREDAKNKQRKPMALVWPGTPPAEMTIPAIIRPITVKILIILKVR